MKRKDDVWIRMARYLAGEMDSKEEIAFVHEMESDPGKRNRMKQMEETWKFFHESHPGSTGDSAKAWERLHDRLDKEGLLEKQASVPLKRSLSPVFRIAASILIVLALGITAVYYGFIVRDDPATTYISEKGVRTVDLPDGSRVYLNQGSEITCPSGFPGERTLELRGEAYFEVMADPGNPFTVSSGRVVVSVIGTSFNMRGSDNMRGLGFTRGSEATGEVEVLVENGKVRMSLIESGQFITLEAGEMGRAIDSRLSTAELNDPNYISWKTKDFKFVDAALAEVLRELEESYHLEIHADVVELDRMRITTTYSQQSIDAILETIGTAFGLTVSKNQEDYYLSP